MSKKVIDLTYNGSDELREVSYQRDAHMHAHTSLLYFLAPIFELCCQICSNLLRSFGLLYTSTKLVFNRLLRNEN